MTGPELPRPELPLEPPARRHVVLVDVGYLYAAGATLALGGVPRKDYTVDTAALIPALLDRAAVEPGGELLRMYWYDAARDRRHTVEHRQVAAMDNVKVRLGNLNSAGQQKGVDAQIRQDLEVLARHRAVSDVVLIAGDEDMVDAVEAAQAFGVRVHVWGVEPPYGTNQAERLLWEADTRSILDADFIGPFLTPTRPPPVPAPEPPQGPTLGVTTGPGPRPAPSPALLAARRPPDPPPDLGPDPRQMREIGEHIAGVWLVIRGRDHLMDLLPGPVLPVVTDKELLVAAEQELKRSLRQFGDARRALREGFWDRVYREFGPQLTHNISDAVNRDPGT